MRELPDNYHIRCFQRLLDRDVGLKKESEHFKHLLELVEEFKPRVLLLDPLRWAIGAETNLVEDKNLVDLVEMAQAIAGSYSDLTVIIVHHTRKKAKDKDVSLRTEPEGWISRVYGGQALLASVECIMGLEKDKDLFVFATVQRNLPELMLFLQQNTDDRRFQLVDDDYSIEQAFKTTKQKELWQKLPQRFERSQADAIAASMEKTRGLVNTVLKNGIKARLLTHLDRGTYEKAISPETQCNDTIQL